MILPCLTVARHAAAPLAHRVLHAIGHARSQIGRHALHRIRHAGHAAVAHTQLGMAMVCHVAPGAFAVAMLALPQPASPAQELLLPPFVTPEQVASDGVAAEMAPPFGPVVWRVARADPSAQADAGSTIMTFLPPDGVPPATPAAVTLAPYLLAPSSTGSVPNARALAHMSFPTLPASAATGAGAQAVPEPSSLLVLTSALCGMGLRRRRTRRPS